MIGLAIQSIATRVNYGLDGETFGEKANLWRWEVHNMDLLPELYRPEITRKRQSRQEFKQNLSTFFEGLDDTGRLNLFGSKRGRVRSLLLLLQGLLLLLFQGCEGLILSLLLLQGCEGLILLLCYMQPILTD